jgi:gluconate 2-dehydrogenase gamma chain
MASWRMIGYPGARYDYRPYIHHDGKALTFEPVSISGHLSLGG